MGTNMLPFRNLSHRLKKYDLRYTIVAKQDGLASVCTE
jgi:hypothetical protein